MMMMMKSNGNKIYCSFMVIENDQDLIESLSGLDWSLLDSITK